MSETTLSQAKQGKAIEKATKGDKSKTRPKKRWQCSEAPWSPREARALWLNAYVSSKGVHYIDLSKWSSWWVCLRSRTTTTLSKKLWRWKCVALEKLIVDPYFPWMLFLLASCFSGRFSMHVWRNCGVLEGTGQLTIICIKQWLNECFYVIPRLSGSGFLSCSAQFPSWRQAVNWVCAVLEPKLTI